MTKGERLRVVRRALKIVTHPARHRDQVAVGIDWSRTDSAQMMAMVAAFVNEMAAPDARPSRLSAPGGNTAETSGSPWPGDTDSSQHLAPYVISPAADPGPALGHSATVSSNSSSNAAASAPVADQNEVTPSPGPARPQP
jgi:hypothetical protein